MNLANHGFSEKEQIEAAVGPLAEYTGIVRKLFIKNGWSRSGAEEITREMILEELRNSRTNNLISDLFKND